MPNQVRGAVNGDGVIGKRVADAIRAQPEMALAGARDIATGYRIKTALVLGSSVYAALPENAAEVRKAGIPVAGTLGHLLKAIDVVVDRTLKGIGVKNLARYRAAGAVT